MTGFCYFVRFTYHLHSSCSLILHTPIVEILRSSPRYRSLWIRVECNRKESGRRRFHLLLRPDLFPRFRFFFSSPNLRSLARTLTEFRTETYEQPRSFIRPFDARLRTIRSFIHSFNTFVPLHEHTGCLSRRGAAVLAWEPLNCFV